MDITYDILVNGNSIYAGLENVFNGVDDLESFKRYCELVNAITKQDTILFSSFKESKDFWIAARCKALGEHKTAILFAGSQFHLIDEIEVDGSYKTSTTFSAIDALMSLTEKAAPQLLQPLKIFWAIYEAL